ncbi:hypothetical protein KAJ26_05140 [bacterium]|nr:hypothetical protein [bacterium]
MRKLYIMVIMAAVFFAQGCVLVGLKYKEDNKYIASTMKSGKPLGLSFEETGKFTDVRDFSASSSRYYLVEGKQRARVNIFDSLGNYLASVDKWQSDEEEGELQFPVSMVLFPDNNIFYLLDSVGKKILIFSSDGRFLREFYDFSDEDEEYPYFPVMLRKNEVSGFLMIVDTYNSRLLEINESGTTIMEIRGGGNDSGKLSFPQSVATDEYGNYYIADGKYVKVFSSRGDHMHNIKNSRIGNVSDLCIWRSRYLVLTDNKENKVHFLSLSGDYIYGTSSAVPGTEFSRPYRVFIDSSEVLYIIDNLQGEVYTY